MPKVTRRHFVPFGVVLFVFVRSTFPPEFHWCCEQRVSMFCRMTEDSYDNDDELNAILQNEEILKKKMLTMTFQTVQENGQRKYGGPPPNWTGPAPPKGCEIFIGKIPRNVFEQELFTLFSKIGTVYELRLMMDFSGTNRGFAFITYATSRDAGRAVRELNNYELRHRHHIGVVKSVDNCRLFVGGIPKNKTQDEFRLEMERLTEGVDKVIVYR